ncbi:testis-expressed protein 264-like [Styela clava]
MEFGWDSICAVAVLIIAGIVGFLYYVGYFFKVKISAGHSVISEVKVAYKFHQGNYDSCGPFFNEIVKLYPNERCMGIYYDNPEVIDPNKCRYIVGVIIAEGVGQVPEKTVVKNLQSRGFKIITFPKVENSVKTTHPFTLTISAYFAGWKAYPALMKYIKDQGLTAHPFLEIYFDRTIHYMVPLSKHDEFYVEEMEG